MCENEPQRSDLVVYSQKQILILLISTFCFSSFHVERAEYLKFIRHFMVDLVEIFFFCGFVNKWINQYKYFAKKN